ncbi:hypothetical protein TIFTF001_028932 [Ficus carica]|uniref:Scarecrow-like protein 18 n=1 Tax=Ficus carica TaxID=3494 RepID=A0AA88J0Q7_FICCA|nr:hypothetical protein TIFTF001_028932 [Ficus carica]
MGSFNSHEQPQQQLEEEEEEEVEDLDLELDQQAATNTSTRDLELYHHHPSSAHSLHREAEPPNALHIRQLLIRCADLISHSDFAAAHRLLSVLSAKSSAYGDATERLVHLFARALFLRLNTNNTGSTGSTATGSYSILSWPPRLIRPRQEAHYHPHHHDLQVYNEAESEAVHSCYLTLNQITPFLRFCHLTANQAILDAIDEGLQALHILDFDIMHGLQWPPFMQALADLPSPPLLRLTATGTDLALLRKTGERLLRFAHSLGLRFQFHPLHHHDDHHLPILLSSGAVAVFPDEALAVNCVLFLHRLLEHQQVVPSSSTSGSCSGINLSMFLNSIKALNPKVVTVAEREANLDRHPLFMPTFVEALDHYAAIFESLEATLPPSSRERMAVEQIWLGREIAEVVKCERRGQRYEAWEVMLGRSGFSNVPLSPFALSQAKLLLRLHYPSEGYRLHNVLNHSYFLAWQNRPLFSVSSWH